MSHPTPPLHNQSPREESNDYVNATDSESEIAEKEHGFYLDEAAELIEQRDRELGAWLADHGMPEESRESYEEYPRETLLELTEQGDYAAASALASQLFRENRNDEAVKVLEIAAAMGSSFALIEAAGMRHPEALGIFSNESPEYREQMLEHLAYIEAAAIRMNPVAGPGSRARLSHAKIILTENELNTIHQKALTHFNRIQQDRIARGLGEFDNSAPDIGVGMMRTMIKTSTEKGENLLVTERAFMEAFSQAESESR